MLRGARRRRARSTTRGSRTTRRGSGTATSSRDALEAVLGTAPSAHWLELLEAEGVPAAEVRDIAQVFAERADRGARRGPDPAPSETRATIGWSALPCGFDRRAVPLPVGGARARRAHARGPDRGRAQSGRGRRARRRRGGDRTVIETTLADAVAATARSSSRRCPRPRASRATARRSCGRGGRTTATPTCGVDAIGQRVGLARAEATATPWSCARTSTRCSVPVSPHAARIATAPGCTGRASATTPSASRRCRPRRCLLDAQGDAGVAARDRRRGGPREPVRRHPRRSTLPRSRSARSSRSRATTSVASRRSASARSGAGSR